MAGYIRVRNFEKWQSFTSRRPTWVKVYLALPSDPSFADLTDAQRWHFIGLLLIAAAEGNIVANRPKGLGRAAGCDGPMDVAALIEVGLVEALTDEEAEAANEQKRSDEEDLRRKRAAAGAKGGKANRKQTVSKPKQVASICLANGSKPEAVEKELEKERELTTAPAADESAPPVADATPSKTADAGKAKRKRPPKPTMDLSEFGRLQGVLGRWAPWVCAHSSLTVPQLLGRDGPELLAAVDEFGEMAVAHAMSAVVRKGGDLHGNGRKGKTLRYAKVIWEKGEAPDWWLAKHWGGPVAVEGGNRPPKPAKPLPDGKDYHWFNNRWLVVGGAV